MSDPAPMGGAIDPPVVNGWRIYVHPVFLAQYEALITQVELLRKKDPDGYKKMNPTKRLAAIQKLVFDVIPQDPTRPEYRQGDTLGSHSKHWFRAKFYQQYRLFFRYDLQRKVIVFAWVNDEQSKRAYGSGDDAYKIFQQMLKSGTPHDAWDELLAEAKLEAAQRGRSG